MANDTTTGIITVVECPSLEQSGLDLGTRNRTRGTVVSVSCDQFGHRPSNDTNALLCQENGTWNRPVPDCEWNWDFKTEDKIVFYTSVAAVSFLIIIIITVFVAYFCCYKKMKGSDERGPEKYDGYANGSATPDKMWLGYIPRPKVSEGRFYN